MEDSMNKNDVISLAVKNITNKIELYFKSNMHELFRSNGSYLYVGNYTIPHPNNTYALIHKQSNDNMQIKLTEPEQDKYNSLLAELEMYMQSKNLLQYHLANLSNYFTRAYDFESVLYDYINAGTILAQFKDHPVWLAYNRSKLINAMWG